MRASIACPKGQRVSVSEAKDRSQPSQTGFRQIRRGDDAGQTGGLIESCTRLKCSIGQVLKLTDVVLFPNRIAR